MSLLSNEEFKRYSRHLSLKGFGLKGQSKLKDSNVLVIGAGGLGCPALLYLAAAGVGKIGIVDHDVISESNLQRQVLFTTTDVGKNKARIAQQRLEELNPHITIIGIEQRLTSNNARDIAKEYTLILDCSDNFPTRYLVNDLGVIDDKPVVHGSVLQFEGQIAVFNVKTKDGYSSNYRDLFPEPPPPSTVPNCEEAGVIGFLPGVIGSLMASEAIKLITGMGEVLSDKLLIVNSNSLEFTTINLQNNNTRKHIKSLIDYDDFCGVNQKKNKSLRMKEITVQELQTLKNSNEDYQLIDVREPHEFDICNLGGELIPLADIPHNVDKVSKAKKVIIHCRSGGRSGQAVKWLEKNHQFENLYNLKGGILAWAEEIDNTMPTY